MPRPRELHDVYFRKAKEDGYVARSAYKLLEVQERRHFLRKGQTVLDIGCAPGSWLQVAEKLVGPNGRVVGIDLQRITAPVGPTVRAIVGDARTVPPAELLALAAREGDAQPPTAFDVVLSDMAPNTTGSPQADHFRSVELCRTVLGLLPPLLRPDGHLVMKVFEGEVYPDLLAECQKLFREAKGLRPDATRDLSREMFILGAGYRPPSMPSGPTGGAAPDPLARPVPPHKRKPPADQGRTR